MNSLTKNNNGSIKSLDLKVINNLCINLSDNTRESYLITGNQFNAFLNKNKHSVNSDSINSFLNSCSWKPGTRNFKMQGLKKIIINQPSYAENFILISAINEMFKKEVKKAKLSKKITDKDYLTYQQIQDLKKVSTKKLSLIIDFLFQTGCRISEMINCRIDEINTNGVAIIKVLGKGNKQRIVYCELDLIEKIKNEFRGKYYLFETKSDKQYNRQNLLKELKRTGKKINIKVNPHIFRHSCAMFLKAKGKDADYIQEYLGHADVSTTIKYYFHNRVNSDIVDLFKT